ATRDELRRCLGRFTAGERRQRERGGRPAAHGKDELAALDNCVAGLRGNQPGRLPGGRGGIGQYVDLHHSASNPAPRGEQQGVWDSKSTVPDTLLFAPLTLSP